MQIILRPQAQEDLNLVEDPLLTEIIARIDCLRSYPYWGAAMGSSFMGYRSFVVGIFRVVYKIISEERIDIVYIRHCRRKPLH